MELSAYIPMLNDLLHPHAPIEGVYQARDILEVMFTFHQKYGLAVATKDVSSAEAEHIKVILTNHSQSESLDFSSVMGCAEKLLSENESYNALKDARKLLQFLVGYFN